MTTEWGILEITGLSGDGIGGQATVGGGGWPNQNKGSMKALGKSTG